MEALTDLQFFRIQQVPNCRKTKSEFLNNVQLLQPVLHESPYGIPTKSYK